MSLRYKKRVAIVVVLAFWLLFAVPALVASNRARRLDARAGSLLEPMMMLARRRVSVVLAVAVGEGLFVMGMPHGDYIESSSVALMGIALIVSTASVVMLLVACVRGVLQAVRIRRAVLRVRAEGVLSPMPGVGNPVFDFGVGQSCWVLQEEVGKYREAAASPVWAHGTPPPMLLAFVGPSLDLLYGVAFLLMTGIQMMAFFG